MDKGIAFRSDEAEDEVALPQLLHHNASRRTGLGKMQFVLQIGFDQVRKSWAVNQIALQALRSGLHVGGDAAENIGFLTHADFHAHPRKILQCPLGIPLVQQQSGSLGIKISPVTRQFLVAI